MADLLLRLIAEDAASGAFDSVGGAVKKATAILYDFGKESTKAFAESEKQMKQLERAAGSLTGSFEKQAQVISRQLAVEDEQVKKLQTLLLSYGAMPGQVDETVRALYDYAAVTGKDVVGSTEQLIRGVESGTGSLGRMGVSFKATGDAAKDMASAVAALHAKFGGAAALDAETLDGRARKASIAMGELKEAFGKMFDELERKYHVLDKVAALLNRIADKGASGGMQYLLGMRGGYESDEEYARAKLGHRTDAASLEVIANARTRDAMGAVRSRELLGYLKSKGVIPTAGGQVDAALPDDAGGGMSVRGGGGQSGYHASALQLEATFQRDLRNKRLQAYEEDLDDEERHYAEKVKNLRAFYELEQDLRDEAMKRADDSSKELQKQLQAGWKQEQKDLRDITNTWVNDVGRDKQLWASAGSQLGGAFSDALIQAMEGGQYAAEDAMLDMLTAVLTIAGSVVGGIAGEGNPYAAQAGATIGNLAGRGISAAAKSGRKRHEGGWIESFHGGGWPGGLGSDEQRAILQTGERVLSRREVSSMGGPAAVDSAARGGGNQVHVHVSTMDVQTTREFFENQGGRGFYNALRTARGQLYPALRG